jgi:hypothetical protein
MAMQLLMVVAAQRHGELVADLASERSRLREFQVVGITWNATADQAGLRCDEREVGLVAAAGLFAQWSYPIFDFRP